jgi:excisionase family DNA binding protein
VNETAPEQPENSPSDPSTAGSSTADPSTAGSSPADAPEAGPRTDVEADVEVSLESLVGEWLTVPEVGERLGLRLSDVRRLIEDRELLAARVGERRVVKVPAKFVDERAMPHLRGTFTVLGDGGMDDEQILRWLFTPDATLPVPGTPVDALTAGFKTEVRRRAMEQAF